MVRTYDFLAPSLHPNTLVDISIPDPGPSSLEPIVRHLPIVHGEFQAVGAIKRIHSTHGGHIVVADDAFRISTLSLGANADGPPVPTVQSQETVTHRSGDVWAGLIPVQGGTISALTSGLLSLHHSSASSIASSSRSVSSPLLALSSIGSSATDFALAGKEVDVSVWDVETTFASSASDATSSTSTNGKRKKNELERGQVWRAKNMPNNSLALRPPNHHLCLTHLPLRGPNHLASGTKSGTIRTYDTRQRKPVQEWKAAREGGVGTIAQGEDEHEVYFSDRANLLGALDLRTGRLLYSYPNMSCTPHHILPLPTIAENGSSLDIGLSSVSSDAGLRIHSTLPPKREGDKGNVGGGRKAKVETMVGGVGIGSFLWRGFGTRDDKPVKVLKERTEGEEDESESEEDDEEVWEGMSEVEDSGEESEEEEVSRKKSRK